MKNLIRIEELAMFILSIFLFSGLSYAWWVFPALLLVPDLSMAGYLVNSKVGAACYNIIHHKAVGICCYLAGLIFIIPILQLTGVILFAHSCMDRMFGFGLKYNQGFKYTHLGVLNDKAAA